MIVYSQNGDENGGKEKEAQIPAERQPNGKGPGKRTGKTKKTE